MRFQSGTFFTPNVAALLLIIGCSLLPLSALAAPHGSSSVDEAVALRSSPAAQKPHAQLSVGIKRSLQDGGVAS